MARQPLDVASLRRAWPAFTIRERNRALRRVVARIDLADDGATLATTWGQTIPLA